jgi:hypothetical protein
MIDFTLNVTTIFISIYKMEEFVRKLSFVILQILVLTIFMIKNVYFIIAVEIRKVSKSTILL